MTDTYDEAALAHYQHLIARRYPPPLAAQLAAAAYAQGLVAGGSLPALRAALLVAQDAYPDLRRDVGRTLAAIDRSGRLEQIP